MTIRAPRKAKKQAKKLVAVHNGMVMMQAAVSAAMHAVQVAHIASRPTPTFIPSDISQKALSVAEVCIDGAKSMQSIMSEIKTWHHFVKPKMRHL